MLLQLNLVQNIIATLSNAFTKLIFALVIFLFGFILGKLIGRFVHKFLKEIEINDFIKKSTGLKINADHLVSSILSYAVYFLSLVAAFDQIGIANIVLYLLSAAIMVLILISFFLAVRDFLPNLISGIYLYRKDIFKEGSKVEINEVKGKLLNIDLFQVKIQTKKGDILYLPNSLVAKSNIKISGQRLKH